MVLYLYLLTFELFSEYLFIFIWFIFNLSVCSGILKWEWTELDCFADTPVEKGPSQFLLRQCAARWPASINKIFQIKTTAVKRLVTKSNSPGEIKHWKSQNLINKNHNTRVYCPTIKQWIVIKNNTEMKASLTVLKNLLGYINAWLRRSMEPRTKHYLAYTIPIKRSYKLAFGNDTWESSILTIN